MKYAVCMEIYPYPRINVEEVARFKYYEDAFAWATYIANNAVRKYRSLTITIVQL